MAAGYENAILRAGATKSDPVLSLGPILYPWEIPNRKNGLGGI